MKPLASLAICLSLAIAGCADSSARGPTEAGATRDVADRLFDSAFALLNRLSEVDSDEALSQIADRLNQWIESKKLSSDTSVDPLVATLPETLRSKTFIESLEAMTFTTADAAMLRECVWMREAARAAVGRQLKPLERAKLLFDWTVRNLQLEADPTPDALRGFQPWQTLLLGKATAEERAWVFALLARQQGLDVVLLATPGDGDRQRVWTAALVHDKQLWLFEPAVGLPIAGADGQGIATLAEASDNTEVLKRLNVEGQPPYRVAADDIKHVTALIVASPQNLSKRMAIVERHLVGPLRLELTVDATAVASQIKGLPHVDDVQLWTVPIERSRPVAGPWQDVWKRQERVFHSSQGDWLWKGRVLEVCGRLTGEHDALVCLMHARPAEEEIAQAREQNQLNAETESAVRAAKQDASYWLGIASFERRNYEAAIDWFSQRTLAASPDGPWTEGARYNLARTYEALGRKNDAIRTYRSTRGPQRLGNLIRARFGSTNPRQLAGDSMTPK